MAWALRFRVLRVSIEPGKLEHDGKGYFVLLGHCAHAVRDYRCREDNPAFRADQERQAMITMAGPLAEGIFLGKRVKPTGSDAVNIRSTTGNHHGGFTWSYISAEEEIRELREDCRRKHLAWLESRSKVHLQAWWPLVESLASWPPGRQAGRCPVC
jgi:hypothetical protein